MNEEKIFSRIRLYLEMIRFSHTLFALPFALLAACMAWYLNAYPGMGGSGSQEEWVLPFRMLDLIGILLAMITARSAAMGFNRLVDREIDAKNSRTANRHLPAGTLKVKSVIFFTGIFSLGFIVATCLFLPRNPLPLVFSVPVLGFLFLYSFMKRYTHFVHFFLGVSLMLAPLAAWVAIRGEILIRAGTALLAGEGMILGMQELAPILLSTAVLFWVSGFDIIYACLDTDFDRRQGVFSIPGWLGTRNALRWAAVCHFLVPFPLLVLSVIFPPFGCLWTGGVFVVILLLIYEHWMVNPRDPVKVNQAFFHVNAVVSLLLLTVGVADMFW
ncbi:MAG: UbiA-like polyprenyltransferase [Planctomycetia bacterium]|nr:UbiA-like polyprenyltransferase [Planctomycetia bacterium]